MMVEGLTAKEIERAKFAFSIYDYDGNDTIDASSLGDLLRVLGLMPTLKAISNMGGTTKRGEKTITIDEFLPIYAAAKKDKDKNALDDVKEMFKLYDREANGYMSWIQLKQMLLFYGEKLEDHEVSEILDDCCEPPDEDGHTRWQPFLDKVLDGPTFEKKKTESSIKSLTAADHYHMLSVPTESFSLTKPKNGQDPKASSKK